LILLLVLLLLLLMIILLLLLILLLYYCNESNEGKLMIIQMYVWPLLIDIDEVSVSEMIVMTILIIKLLSNVWNDDDNEIIIIIDIIDDNDIINDNKISNMMIIICGNWVMILLNRPVLL